MVDPNVRAAKTAAILEAVQWIRENLPDTVEQFHEEEETRESRGPAESDRASYNTIDFDRLYASASADLDDLLAFCRALAS